MPDCKCRRTYFRFLLWPYLTSWYLFYIRVTNFGECEFFYTVKVYFLLTEINVAIPGQEWLSFMTLFTKVWPVLFPSCGFATDCIYIKPMKMEDKTCRGYSHSLGCFVLFCLEMVHLSSAQLILCWLKLCHIVIQVCRGD
jgi:hypothetical protein